MVDPGDNGSFEERLRSARDRRGLDTPSVVPAVPSDSGALGGSALRLGLRVGAELVSALAVGALIGWLLDRWLGTRPILLGVFVLLGGVAGVLNVWRMVAPKPADRGRG